MKFVIRILDAKDNLLAWAQVEGTMRPGGRIVSTTPATIMPIEQTGIPVSVTIHWTDLDIARREDFLGETELVQGTVGTFNWFSPLWVIQGQQNVPLPPVTVRIPVSISVPNGSFGIETR